MCATQAPGVPAVCNAFVYQAAFTQFLFPCLNRRRGTVTGTVNGQCIQANGVCGRKFSTFQAACAYDTQCQSQLVTLFINPKHKDIDNMCMSIPLGTPAPASASATTPSSVMVEICNDFVRCASSNNCWRAGGEMFNTVCISNFCWTSFDVFNRGCRFDPVCSKAINQVGNFTRTAIRHVCAVDGTSNGGLLTFPPSPAGNQGRGRGSSGRGSFGRNTGGGLPNQQQIPGGAQSAPSTARNFNPPPSVQRSPTQQPVIMTGAIPSGALTPPGWSAPAPRVDHSHPPIPPTKMPVASPTWATNIHQPGSARQITAAPTGSSSAGVWIGILISCFVVAGGVFWYLRSKDLRAIRV